MSYTQVDMFDDARPVQQKVAPEVILRVKKRLEDTIKRLEREKRFCWSSNLEAIHEENSFRASAALLGDEGDELWARFDRELERLYAA